MARLYKSGTGLVVNIPQVWVKLLKFKPGLEVAFQVNDKGRLEIIRMEDLKK